MSLTRKIFNVLLYAFALFGLLCLVGGGVAAVYVVKSHNLPPRVIARKVLEKSGLDMPVFLALLTPAPLKPEGVVLPPLDTPDWAGQGARPGRVLQPFFYTPDELRPVPALWLSQAEQGAQIAPQSLRHVFVDSTAALLKAMRTAQPGDVITLEPGVYRLKRRSIGINRPGKPDAPIMVRAAQLGQVRLELNTLEGFLVHAPFWVFENLDIKGTCSSHDRCEHAFHVVGKARGFVLRNSRLHEFNAMIKANGLTAKDGARIFPDGALIEGNSFYNSSIRQTRSAVAFIDVVGANSWTIRENLLADHAKGRGDRISTAAFIKGNASGGVFENNLVIGEYAHSGGTRIGLSFGGGGTTRAASRHKDNTTEHTGGIIRNNVIMYTRDVGLYMNKARETSVEHNILFRTMGIDVRFPQSSAVIRNNLLDGKIRDRDGGRSIRENNLILNGGIWGHDFPDLFQDPGQGDFSILDGSPLAAQGLFSRMAPRDFCDNPRPNPPSIGPFEVHGKTPCLPFRMQPSGS